jgi:hypothetical protein
MMKKKDKNSNPEVKEQSSEKKTLVITESEEIKEHPNKQKKTKNQQFVIQEILKNINSNHKHLDMVGDVPVIKCFDKHTIAEAAGKFEMDYPLILKCLTCRREYYCGGDIGVCACIDLPSQGQDCSYRDGKLQCDQCGNEIELSNLIDEARKRPCNHKGKFRLCHTNMSKAGKDAHKIMKRAGYVDQDPPKQQIFPLAPNNPLCIILSQTLSSHTMRQETNNDRPIQAGDNERGPSHNGQEREHPPANHKGKSDPMRDATRR